VWVLVVEDARSLAAVLAEGLRDRGMAADVANDGLKAAGKLDVKACDVVSSTATWPASTAHHLPDDYLPARTGSWC
jgi:DNA-binding response OmpR family regulator